MTYEITSGSAAARPARGWLLTGLLFCAAMALAVHQTRQLHDPAAAQGWLIRFDVPGAMRPVVSGVRGPVIAYEVPLREAGDHRDLVVAVVYMQEFRGVRAADLQAVQRRCLRTVLGGEDTRRWRMSTPREVRVGPYDGIEVRLEGDVAVVSRACLVEPGRAYVWVLKSMPAFATDTQRLLDHLTASVRPAGD